MIWNKNKRCNVSHETLLHAYKVLFLFLVLIPIISPSFLAISTVDGLTTNEYLLIDKQSKVILAGENYDTPSGIASISKIMSYYVYMDKITADNIDIESTTIPISDEIVDNISKNSELSGVYFDYNTELPLTEMFDLMLVYSDNGATMAIGEYLFGSEEAAVVAMNEKAQTLGLENTTYYNTTGLTMSDYQNAMLEGSKPTDYNVSTAREQLELAESLLQTYPQILDIVGKSYVNYNGYTLANFNLMLPELDYDYPGVVGLKTGSSNEAGYCFLGYYINEETNEEFLSIVLNSTDRNKRFTDTTIIYNWLNEQEMETIMPAGSEFDLNISGSADAVYKVHTKDDYYFPITSDLNLERNQFVYNQQYFDADNKLIKDIPAGEVIGSFTYQIADDNVEENIVETIQSPKNTLNFEVVSDKDIKVDSTLGALFTATVDYYIKLYEGI